MEVEIAAPLYYKLRYNSLNFILPAPQGFPAMTGAVWPLPDFVKAADCPSFSAGVSVYRPTACVSLINHSSQTLQILPA